MKEKQSYFIGYEYQVIIPLMYLRESSNQDIIEMTQFQMIDYRVKTAQEFAYNYNSKVKYETGREGLNKFISNYNSYVKVIEIDEQIIYRLEPSFTIEMYESMLSRLDEDIRNVLTDENIIKSCLKENILS